MVRPLVSLLNLECTLLQNFEALMALTNLAGISDRLRLATRGRSPLSCNGDMRTEIFANLNLFVYNLAKLLAICPECGTLMFHFDLIS